MAILVLVAVPQSKAVSLAKVILAKRLGVCINIVKGVDSYFW